MSVRAASCFAADPKAILLQVVFLAGQKSGREKPQKADSREEAMELKPKLAGFIARSARFWGRWPRPRWRSRRQRRLPLPRGRRRQRRGRQAAILYIAYPDGEVLA